MYIYILIDVILILEKRSILFIYTNYLARKNMSEKNYNFSVEVCTSQDIGHIERCWLDLVSEDNNILYDITSTLFENIIAGNHYGNPVDRSNQSTFVAVKDKELSEILAMVEVVFHRHGSNETICKVMDIALSPKMEGSDFNMHLKVYGGILKEVIIYILGLATTSARGTAKIYAKQSFERHIIEEIYNALKENERFLKETGLSVERHGGQWLALIKK